MTISFKYSSRLIKLFDVQIYYLRRSCADISILSRELNNNKLCIAQECNDIGNNGMSFVMQ